MLKIKKIRKFEPFGTEVAYIVSVTINKRCMEKNINWKEIHRNATIALLSTYVGGFGTSTEEKYRPKQVATCIAYADELIKQLKERENIEVADSLVQ